MNDPLDNMKTMQHGPSYDTIGDILTQRPDEAVILAGRYRIIRKLGEGGMGSVWLAQDTRLDDRQVAIKMLPVVLVANSRAIQQLKAEAKVAIQLAHPNIATLRAFEESEQGPFLVIDYVPGQTLEDLLAERSLLAQEDVLRIFTPIAEALDYAHSQNVVHRDIKPSNILIRTDGTPLITDFGVAREMKDTMTRVTGHSTSGTLPYMSPEQLRGSPPVPAQDIYSFAASMYECFSGHPPFYRGQIEYQIAHEPVPPLGMADMLLECAIMRCLAKRPEERLGSCRQLVQSQATAVDSRSPQAVPPESAAPMQPRQSVTSKSIPTGIEHAGSVDEPHEQALAYLKARAKQSVRFAAKDHNTWHCVCGISNPLDESKEIQNCRGCHRNRDFTLKNYTREAITRSIDAEERGRPPTVHYESGARDW